jgi:Tol biopolymer transport system component
MGTARRRLPAAWLHRVLSKDQAPGELQCCGEWTPDGQYFVFTATTGHRPNLWVLREPGFALRRMQHNPLQVTDWPTGAFGAHVTPDGKSVLFYAGRNRSQIVRLDLKTGKFAPVSPEGFSQPEYSPDGKWVVYVDVNNGILWKVSSDGATRYPLSLPDIVTNFPRWSPDGKRIAVNMSRGSGPSNIFLISANGGAPELLLPNQLSSDVDWAPDGKSLVVVHSLPEHPDQRALFQVDLATRSERMVPGSIGRFFPHWSSDGHYLAAYGDREPGVAIFNWVTLQWQEVVGGTIGYPSWSRDGRYLYYQRILEESEPIYRYNPRNLVTERVADCSMELGSGVSRCAFFGLAPDNSPLLDITRGAYDLYSAELTLPK